MQTTDNRTKLLQVALTLFSQRGYDATGVQDIVAAAGVTKPTLYHYFGSKVGLLDALLRERSETFLAAFTEATRFSGDLTGTLGRIVAITLDFVKRQPEFFRFQLMLRFLPPDHEAQRVAAPFLDRQLNLLEAMFLDASMKHGNMRGRHERYAFTFFGHLHSSAVLIMNGHLTDSDQLRHDLVHQFSYGIYS